jgi:hypothetical protein
MSTLKKSKQKKSKHSKRFSKINEPPPSFNLEKAMKRYPPSRSVAHYDTDDDDDDDDVGFDAARIVHGTNNQRDEDTGDEEGDSTTVARYSVTNIKSVIKKIRTRMLELRITRENAKRNNDNYRVELNEINQEILKLEKMYQNHHRIQKSYNLQDRANYLNKILSHGTLFENIEKRIRDVTKLYQDGNYKAAFHYATWIFNMLGTWGSDDLRSYKGGRGFRKHKRKSKKVRRRRHRRRTRRRRRRRRRRSQQKKRKTRRKRN